MPQASAGADAGAQVSVARQEGKSVSRDGGGKGAGRESGGVMSEDKMEKRIASMLEEFVEIRLVEEVCETCDVFVCACVYVKMFMSICVCVCL